MSDAANEAYAAIASINASELVDSIPGSAVYKKMVDGFGAAGDAILDVGNKWKKVFDEVANTDWWEEQTLQMAKHLEQLAKYGEFAPYMTNVFIPAAMRYTQALDAQAAAAKRAADAIAIKTAASVADKTVTDAIAATVQAQTGALNAQYSPRVMRAAEAARRRNASAARSAARKRAAAERKSLSADNKLITGGTGKTFQESIAGESARSLVGEESFDASLQQDKPFNMSGAAVKTIASNDNMRKQAKAARELAEQTQNLADIEKDRFETLSGIGASALSGLANGMWSAIDAAVSGQSSFGAAIAKMTRSLLMGIAKQATVKAIFELAQALSMLFINPPEAASHFLSAGMFAAAAVAAGVAAVAIPAPSSASSTSSGEANRRASDNAAGGASSDNDKDKRPIVINVHYDRSDPAQQRLAAYQLQQQLNEQAA